MIDIEGAMMTGDVGRFVGRSNNTILWYVKRGWLTPISTTPSGRRLYAATDVMAFAAKLKARERRGRRAPAPAA